MNETLYLKVFKSLGENASLMLKSDELWISSTPIDNSYQFEREINSSSQMKTARAIKYKSIEKFKMNPTDSQIKFFYKTILDEKKSKSFVFANEAELEFVLNHLQGVRSFTSSQEKESILTPILKYGMPLLIILGVILIINLFMPEGQIEVSGRRAFLKTIYNTIGKTGFNVIGGVVSSILLFLLGKRISNPTNEIVYK